MSFSSVRLDRFLRHRSEFIEIHDERRYKRLRVQLHGRGIILRDEVEGIEVKTKRQQVVRAGDFVVAEIDAKFGGFGLVRPDLDGGIVSSHYFIFDTDESVCLRQWLDTVVRAGRLEEQVLARGSTNYAAIRPAHVLEYEIPLPPIPEQHRIVRWLEPVISRVRETAELGGDVAVQIERVLAAATAKVFERISGAPLVPTVDLVEIRGGIQKTPEREAADNPVRYLTVAHVHRNRISTDDPRYFEVKPEEFERWRLLPGDVLIIEGNGSADQIGRTAIFRGEIRECVHQNHVIRMRPDPTRLRPEFLNFYLNSPPGQREVQAQSRTTSGLRSLSVRRIEQIRVPLPPLTEQLRIIARLENLERQVDALRQTRARSTIEINSAISALYRRALDGNRWS